MPLSAAPVANGNRNKLTNGHSNRSDTSLSSAESLADNMDRVGVDGASRPQQQRKLSSPLMPAFMVSAPGKVIVYGEHAVVHGKAAIAASISLRSYLLVTFLSKSRRTVSLRFPDIQLDHTW